MEKNEQIKIKHLKITGDAFCIVKRKNTDLIIGETYNVKTPKNTFKSILINKNTLKIEEVSTEFLTSYTETRTRFEALTELKNIFTNELIESNDVTFLYFQIMGMN